jgi:hypothetical protein
MALSRKVRRWISIVALSGLAFAQASIALAACQTDRGTMGGAAAMQMDEGCGGCPSAPAGDVVLENTCVAHCTSDLQLNGAAVALVRDGKAATALLVTPPGDRHITPKPFASPPRALPARILLHSFLI